MKKLKAIISVLLIITLFSCKKKTTEPGGGTGGNQGGLGTFHLRMWTVNKNADSVEYARDTLKYLVLDDWIYDTKVWDEFDTIIPINKEVYFYNGNYLQLVIELDLPIGVINRGDGTKRDYGCQTVENGIAIRFRNVPDDSTIYQDNTGEVKYKNGTIRKPAFTEFTTRFFLVNPNDPDWVRKGDTLDIAIVYDWSCWGGNQPCQEMFYDNPFSPYSGVEYTYFRVIDPDTFQQPTLAKKEK